LESNGETRKAAFLLERAISWRSRSLPPERLTKSFDFERRDPDVNGFGFRGILKASTIGECDENEIPLLLLGCRWQFCRCEGNS